MMTEILAVILLVVVAPIWILAHYATAWRNARLLSREHERVLVELTELAQRMEARMDTLERILETDPSPRAGGTS
ncbi:MAG: envelope stress response membrane protein PspB [Rhodospirillales bacterium]|nr:envelope stress response membrane protein PspB [Rhodospirillales bacterium]